MTVTCSAMKTLVPGETCGFLSFPGTPPPADVTVCVLTVNGFVTQLADDVTKLVDAICCVLTPCAPAVCPQSSKSAQRRIFQS